MTKMIFKKQNIKENNGKKRKSERIKEIVTFF
jgi:hypothetical protein